MALNRAVVVAELEGPDRALELLQSSELTEYQPYWVARAELPARCGRGAEAVDTFAGVR